MAVVLMLLPLADFLVPLCLQCHPSKLDYTPHRKQGSLQQPSKNKLELLPLVQYK